MLNADLAVQRKGQCIYLTKDIHAKVRSKSIMQGLSMAEIFVEFGRLYAEGNVSIQNIVDKLALRKSRAALDKEVKKAEAAEAHMDKYDSDVLYAMIDDSHLNENSDVE